MLWHGSRALILGDDGMRYREERGMEDTQAVERRPTSCQAVWATHDVSPRKVTRPCIGE